MPNAPIPPARATAPVVASAASARPAAPAADAHAPVPSASAAPVVPIDVGADEFGAGEWGFPDEDVAARRVLGRPHPDRARQFVPFAALRGYYDLVHERERIPAPRRELSEDEARELNAVLAQVDRGSLVSVTYYDGEAYVTCEGRVSQKDEIYHDLWVIRTRIPFAAISALRFL